MGKPPPWEGYTAGAFGGEGWSWAGASRRGGSAADVGRVADGQAAVGVEEVQVLGVDHEVDLLAGADVAAGVDAGGPQRLVADQGKHGGLLVVACVLGGDGVLVLDRRGVDEE